MNKSQSNLNFRILLDSRQGCANRNDWNKLVTRSWTYLKFSRTTTSYRAKVGKSQARCSGLSRSWLHNPHCIRSKSADYSRWSLQWWLLRRGSLLWWNLSPHFPRLAAILWGYGFLSSISKRQIWFYAVLSAYCWPIRDGGTWCRNQKEGQAKFW